MNEKSDTAQQESTGSGKNVKKDDAVPDSKSETSSTDDNHKKSKPHEKVFWLAVVWVVVGFFVFGKVMLFPYKLEQECIKELKVSAQPNLPESSRPQDDNDCTPTNSAKSQSRCDCVADVNLYPPLPFPHVIIQTTANPDGEATPSAAAMATKDIRQPEPASPGNQVGNTYSVRVVHSFWLNAFILGLWAAVMIALLWAIVRLRQEDYV